MIKIRLFYGFIILVFIASSCQENEVLEFDANSKLKSKIIKNGAQSYRYEYNENGNKKSEGEIIGNSKIGPWVYYNVDGKPMAKGTYENDFKIGRWYYNVSDTAFEVEWDTFENSLIKINLPRQWIIIRDLTKFMPIAAYSDTSKLGANFNLTFIKNENKSVDSLVVENFRKNFNADSSKVLFIQDVTINDISGKEVTQKTIFNKKNWYVVQYFLIRGDSVFLVSFFISADQLNSYKDVIKEIIYSLKIK